MKKNICSLCLFFLIYFSLMSWAMEDNIEMLKSQILALEKQKAQLESTKAGFIDQGDELLNKIEELKLQSQSGLGIIGRYKLSQNLKKAQKLSSQIQEIEKNINNIENEINIKKTSLENEYALKITSLLQRLDVTEKAEARKIILEQIKAYQLAKDQLSKLKIDKQNKSLEYKGIEISENDGPQEIREKADLLSDIASKTNRKIKILDTRISKLKDELNTRKKLGEFTEEISFINDRFPRSQVVAAKSVKSDTSKPEDLEENQENIQTFVTDNQPKIRSSKPETDVPATTDTQTSESIKNIIKSNGTSADFSQKPLNRIEEEIKALEKQKQELRSELSTLNEKVNYFRKKADEIEKSESKSSVKKQLDGKEIRQKKK